MLEIRRRPLEIARIQTLSISAKPKVARLICAHEFHIGFVGNTLLEASRPVGSIDEESAQVLVQEIGRSSDRAREYPIRLSGLVSVVSQPNDRHHGFIDVLVFSKRRLLLSDGFKGGRGHTCDYLAPQ